MPKDAYHGPLEPVNDCCWRIPKSYKAGMRVDGLIYADKHLIAPYTPETVFDNKPLCKADLQRRFLLSEEPKTPVLGMVARLVSQKGIDLVLSTAPGLLDLGLGGKVLLGSDFPNIPYAYEHQIEALERLGLGDAWLARVLWHNGAELFGRAG